MSRTAMQTTSLDAYFNTILPNINNRQREILRVFIDNPALNFTNLELAENELGWPINSVTGRVYELRGRDKRFPMKEPIIIESERRQSILHKRWPASSTDEPIYSKHKHIAWQMNPYWSPGGYKIE